MIFARLVLKFNVIRFEVRGVRGGLVVMNKKKACRYLPSKAFPRSRDAFFWGPAAPGLLWRIPLNDRVTARCPYTAGQGEARG